MVLFLTRLLSEDGGVEGTSAEAVSRKAGSSAAMAHARRL